MQYEVIPIPCFKDNYAYLLISKKNATTIVIDPGEFSKVWQVLQAKQLKLSAVLLTHHHWDHVGGNLELAAHLPGLPIYGFHTDIERIPGANHPLKVSDVLQFGDLQGTLTHNPGHTSGAISYYFDDLAFTGDTLFGASCGRLFEGTAAEMADSLLLQIGRHPASTKIYFGHEYTAKNLQFAALVEADNPKINQRILKVQQQLSQGQPTTGSTLQEEWDTNPFMRYQASGIQKTVLANDPTNDLSPTAVIKVLRLLKDKF